MFRSPVESCKFNIVLEVVEVLTVFSDSAVSYYSDGLVILRVLIYRVASYRYSITLGAREISSFKLIVIIVARILTFGYLSGVRPGVLFN